MERLAQRMRKVEEVLHREMPASSPIHDNRRYVKLRLQSRSPTRSRTRPVARSALRSGTGASCTPDTGPLAEKRDLRSERFRQRQPRWRKLPSGSVTVPSAPFPVIDREDALFVRQRASVYGEKEGHPSGGALVAARYTESRARSSAAANPLDVRPGREGLEPGSRAPQAVFETVQEPFECV